MVHLFSVFNKWVDHPDFSRCVRDSWEQAVFGTRLTKVVSKLKWMKLVLKAWNKSAFGWTDHHIHELGLRIEELESRLLGQYDKDTEQDLIASKIELHTWEKEKNLDWLNVRRFTGWSKVIKILDFFILFLK